MIHPPMDLVTNIVDQQARANPDALYAEYPISEWSYEEGYHRITWSDLAHAVNGAAWWLHDTLGPGKDFEALAYIGPNDLRYIALIIGAVKAGYMMFLTSPRNSVAAHANLLDRLKCKIILSPNPRPAPTSTILASCQLRVVEVPSVEDLLGESYPPFPFEKGFLEARSEPLFAVHTSGSTGLPKPLIYTHDTLARNTRMMSLEPPLGSQSQHRVYQGKRMFSIFPPFHAAYLVTHLCAAVSFRTIIIHPTSGPIPSAEGLVQGLKKTSAEIAFVAPSIVQELCQSPELLDYCSNSLELIIYGGGDLPQSIGDHVASKVRVVNQFGISEMGMTANILAHTRSWRDWKYVQFHPDLGIELRCVTDDMFELLCIRDPEKEQQQPAFTMFPELQEYSSHDLFVPHPSIPNLWNWRGRSDDIIVFLNGEKTNPVTMEQRIAACNPSVSAVLVAGAQRFQAALLIEPAADAASKVLSPADRAAFIEDIWPSISECNKECPSHARITKSHIVFTKPQRPMLRTAKGTLRRSGTLRLYADEIDELYSYAKSLSTEVDGESLRISGDLDDISVSQITRETISSVLNKPNIEDFDNLFALGMDSLQALMIARKLKQGLGMTIALSTLYNNPSISALASAIIRLWRQERTSQESEAQERSRVRSIIFEQYRDMINQMPVTSEAPKKVHDEVVVLTGSTGALGSYVLHTLLAKQIAHIYCLNRASDSRSLQIERNQGRGLSTQLDASRVTFLTVDLTQKQLGLSPEIYNRLTDSATLVIHNAWPVNFNLSLSSFRPQLDSLINLIHFTAIAATSPHLFFISSVGSVLSYHTPSLRTQEEVVSSNSAPGPNGYAESKHLSERLLDHAAQKLFINTSVTRVAQIAGAVNHAGLWNKAEWFPSLVLSSIHVRAIPDSLGPTMSKIDWVPIDLLAEVIVDLAPGRHDQATQKVPTYPKGVPKHASVFHPLNPHPTTWEAVRQILIDELSCSPTAAKSIKEPLETISLGAWLAKVRRDMEVTVGSHGALKDEDLADFLQVNPAVKLLGFYEEALGAGKGPGNEMEIGETLRRSARLRDVQGIKPEWVRKWVREWLVSME